MPKGTEQQKNAKKKPRLTLKEKRQRKREKKMEQSAHVPHDLGDFIS